MKHWYIVLADKEVCCPFVSVSQASGLLFLSYNGVTVKIRVHDFAKTYRQACDGIPTGVVAISKRGIKHNVNIDIVFK